MKKILNTNIYLLELVLLIIFGLTPVLWYKPDYIALGHDMSFPLFPQDFFLDRLFIWTDRMSGFGVNRADQLSGIFIHGLEAFFSFMGLSLVHTQQITFIFWFLLPGVTMYILLRSIYTRKEDFTIRLSGSLFYMMNHYLLQAWTIAERTKFSVMSALPLVVLVLFNVFYRKKSSLKQAILLSMILFFLNGGAGIPLWGSVFIVLFAFLIALVLSPTEKFFSKLKRLIVFLSLLGFFVVALNFYWLYPYIKSFTINYGNIQSVDTLDRVVIWSGEISKFASFSNLFRMQGLPDWYGRLDHPFASIFLNNPFFIFLSFIFPILGFIGAVFSKGDGKTQKSLKLFLIIVLLVSIPFAAGSHPPFGSIYDFLLKNLPGFSMFRTPIYKFGIGLWFAYSFLIALGMKNIVSFISKRFNYFKDETRTGVGLLSLFTIFLVIYNFPFFNGSFFNWSQDYSTMVKVPKYILDAKNEFEKNKFSTRTVLMPELDRRNLYEVYNWRYFSLSTIPSILTRKPVIINDVGPNQEELALILKMYDDLEKNGDSFVLDYFGADKIVLRNDFSPPEDYGYSTEEAKNFVKNSKYLSLSQKIGLWDFYDIDRENLRPLIYISPSTSYIYSQFPDLDKAIQLLSNSSEDNIFIYSDMDQGNLESSPEEGIAQYIIQGDCQNCGSTEKSFTVPENPPALLPGTPFYFLAKLLQDKQLQGLRSPQQVIDFYLNLMSQKIAAIQILTKGKTNTNGINESVKELEEDLIQIENNYSKLPNKYKQSYLIKVQTFIEFFIGRNNYAREVLRDTQSRVELDRLDQILKEYQQTLNTQSGDFVREEQSFRYEFRLPQTDNYYINVKTNSPLVNTSNLPVIVSDNTVQLKSKGNGWFQAGPLKMEKGIASAYLPTLQRGFVKKVFKGNFNLENSGLDFGCTDISMENTDPGNNYRIKFDMESVVGAFFNTAIVEGNVTKSKTSNFEIISTFFLGERQKNTYETMYHPSARTSESWIRFCVKPKEGNSKATVLVKNFEISQELPIPAIFIVSEKHESKRGKSKVEFVALNQTKYLVRISNFSDNKTEQESNNFILNLNSRFDPNWKVREIDSTKAAGYFIGQTKVYSGGKVIEYERQDGHKITDVLFPIKDDGYTSDHFNSNVFANSWGVNKKSTDPNNPTVLLLEYDLQNSFYRASLISVVTFLLLIGSYGILLKYGRK